MTTARAPPTPVLSEPPLVPGLPFCAFTEKESPDHEIPHSWHGPPASITKQFVEVTGNAPGAAISVSWQMGSAYGSSSQGTAWNDFSGGQRAVIANSVGTYHRNIFDATTGDLSDTLTSYGGSYVVDTKSIITPAIGSSFTSLDEHKFTVSVIH